MENEACACGCGRPRHGRSKFYSRACMNREYNRRRPVVRMGGASAPPPNQPLIEVLAPVTGPPTIKGEAHTAKFREGTVPYKLFLDLRNGAWVTALDINQMDVTCPSTRLSEIRRGLRESRMPYRVEKRWNSNKGTRGVWEYRIVEIP